MVVRFKLRATSTMSILVVAPWNVAREEKFLCSMIINIVTGSWYPGVFVSDRESEERWLRKKHRGVRSQ